MGLRAISRLRKASPVTQVLIVPSLDEVLSFHPLPQPPMDVALGARLGAGIFDSFRNLGVRFLPNPAHASINGFRCSFTSADALSPVLRDIVLRPEGKKIEEAQRLLLQQRTLFPVVPRDPANVCEARAAALDFPFAEDAVPDVCIFPSVSGNPSGAIVDGTVFVNPGPLCRPNVVGTLAELWITKG